MHAHAQVYLEWQGTLEALVEKVRAAVGSVEFRPNTDQFDECPAYSADVLDFRLSVLGPAVDEAEFRGQRDDLPPVWQVRVDQMSSKEVIEEPGGDLTPNLLRVLRGCGIRCSEHHPWERAPGQH